MNTIQHYLQHQVEGVGIPVFHKKIKKKSGFVYAVTDGAYVKIGKAEDVQKRISHLQTGNRRSISVIAAGKYSNAYIAESLFHREFCSYRIFGEWFDLPDIALNALVKMLRDEKFPNPNHFASSYLMTECPNCGNEGYPKGYCFSCSKHVPAVMRGVYFPIWKPAHSKEEQISDIIELDNFQSEPSVDFDYDSISL